MINKLKFYCPFALILSLPVIIYIYFLKCRCYTIYGDDLSLFIDVARAKNFIEVIGIATKFGKFRPVSALFSKLIFELFGKNLTSYYIFNVLIQSINTYVLALILNIILKSPIKSLLFSLIFGISKFSFFVTSQPLSGGTLEGLAMTFFLISLYFISYSLLNNTKNGKQIQKTLLYSILFANLSLYTHERYIIIFPFIILTVLTFPGLKIMTTKQKIIIISISTISIFINILVKKYIYFLHFFVGTSGVNISFSFNTTISFLSDSILSIFMINSGNPSHFGILFTSLSKFLQISILLLVTTWLFILLLFVLKYTKSRWKNNNTYKNRFLYFIFLLIIFLFCLVPVVATIRVEQRWLQAPFSISLIMMVIAINELFLNTKSVQTIISLSFILSYIAIDRIYFDLGVPNLYISHAQKEAIPFENAVKNGIINIKSNKLYILEKNINMDFAGALNWDLGGGYFFWFYQGKSKQLVFTDLEGLKNSKFRSDSGQIVYYKDAVYDVTSKYCEDSLNNFNY